jgi:hypothetical protein
VIFVRAHTACGKPEAELYHTGRWKSTVEYIGIYSCWVLYEEQNVWGYVFDDTHNNLSSGRSE